MLTVAGNNTETAHLQLQAADEGTSPPTPPSMTQADQAPMLTASTQVTPFHTPEMLLSDSVARSFEDIGAAGMNLLEDDFDFMEGIWELPLLVSVIAVPERVVQ